MLRRAHRQPRPIGAALPDHPGDEREVPFLWDQPVFRFNVGRRGLSERLYPGHVFHPLRKRPRVRKEFRHFGLWRVDFDFDDAFHKDSPSEGSAKGSPEATARGQHARAVWRGIRNVGGWSRHPVSAPCYFGSTIDLTP
jgi:hypothetical protein